MIQSSARLSRFAFNDVRVLAQEYTAFENKFSVQSPNVQHGIVPESRGYQSEKLSKLDVTLLSGSLARSMMGYSDFEAVQASTSHLCLLELGDQ